MMVLISENFQNYSNNYGNEIIKPIYANLTNIIDESSKDIIVSNINKNIKNYEDKLNIIQFNDLSNNKYLLTKEIFEKIKKIYRYLWIK